MDGIPNQKEISDVKIVLNQLKDELNERKDESLIAQLEQKLSENIEYLININDFYSLPIDVIQNIIEQVDFEEIDDCFQLLKTFLSNLSNINENSVSILKSIQCSVLQLKFDECIDLISLIQNCELLIKISDLYQKSKTLVSPDYKYTIQRKEEEIKEMLEYMDDNDLFYVPKVEEKPHDFESNIYEACNLQIARAIIKIFFYELSMK